MTLQFLLDNMDGSFPSVYCNRPVKGVTSQIGKVVLIKDNGKFKGCAVQFPGLKYDTWFTDDENGTDQRSHYMKELSFVSAIKISEIFAFVKFIGDNGYTKHQVNDRWYDADNFIGDTRFIYGLFKQQEDDFSFCDCISRIGVNGPEHGPWTCRSCGKLIKK